MKVALLICIVVIVLLVYWIYLDIRDVKKLRKRIKGLERFAEKETPKKPIFVDNRFRQRGQKYGECVSLESCYKCPNCNTHLFHDFESEKYCESCGQLLDWGEVDEKKARN